jgi:Fe2+ or Zn2+ uptake regulation protein
VALSNRTQFILEKYKFNFATDMNVQEVQNHLISHHIKPSVQRVAIMQYLMENKTHPTIDQIFNYLLPSIPTLSRMTVYNTLKLFSDKKAALAITIDEKNIRYDAEVSTHAHFKCKKCGKIEDILLESTDVPAFRGTEKHVLEDTQIYFTGICDKCNPDSQENSWHLGRSPDRKVNLE